MIAIKNSHTPICGQTNVHNDVRQRKIFAKFYDIWRY